MSRPVALLTDFGCTDAYVGVMKGVLLSRCPDVRLFDLTHGIPAGGVLAGALQLASAVRYCPPDTVFLAVVDPGVGGERRPICARSGGHLFVGPDNGLLWPAMAALGPPEAFHLNRARCWLPNPGATFHGRDVFAPIAAMLASNRAPEEFGAPIADAVRLEIPLPTRGSADVAGIVLYIDHFGNAVTNLRPDDLEAPAPGSRLFHAGDVAIRGPSGHYGSVGRGEPVVVLGSLGYYEIAVNGGSASSAFGLREGIVVGVGEASFVI